MSPCPKISLIDLKICSCDCVKYREVRRADREYRIEWGKERQHLIAWWYIKKKERKRRNR